MKKYWFLLLLIFSFSLNIFSQIKLQDSLVMKFVNNVIANTNFENDFSKNKYSRRGSLDLSKYPEFEHCSNFVVMYNLKNKTNLFVFQMFDQKKGQLITIDIILFKNKIIEIQTYYVKNSLETKIHLKNGEEFAEVFSKQENKISKMKIPLEEIQDVILFYIKKFI